MAPFLTFCFLITIFCSKVLTVEAVNREMQTLHRQKREWFIPPVKLMENENYINKPYIAKIRSDEETRMNIEYSLLGPAVDEGLFSVNKKNGYVKIHGILNREENAFYDLKGRATFPDGSLAETDLNLKVIVEDQNDCAPVFKIQMVGFVDELSEKDTYVIVVTASDADDNTTDNAKIAYKIIQQEPVGEMMFNIHRSSGEIKVRMNTLDREKQETYKLIIIGTDMDGYNSDPQNRPMTGTGTVTLNIRDVNDNVPELEENSYNFTVKETIRNVEAIRLKATDKDKPYTENWEAVYTIISGNEDGYFNISTDPKTNEGILIVTKELDYETMKKIDLVVVVNNKATYHKSVVLGKPKTYPIKIKVLNELEAPHFQHPVKVISITENRNTIDLKKVIITFTATDSDTLLTATDVRYVKGEDVNNLVSINEQTAEVRLNKYPEHKFLKNGEYTAKILCITNDVSPKTATGTLVIQVQDFENHCPIQISPHGKMCYGDSVVYVTAKDEEKYTNANPFKYKMVSKHTKENWSCEKHNTTTVILRSQEILWPGYYTVGIVVQDQEEKSCEVQKLQITVCTCTEAKVCQYERQSGTSAVLGIGGVLGFLLVILLLFAILMILLLCECRRGFRKFQAFPFEEEQRHIVYHIEGRGEDQELQLISQLPVNVDGGSSGQFIDACEDWRKYGWESQEEYINNHLLINQYEGDYVDKNATTLSGGPFEHFGTIAGMALPQTFLHNYYAKKTMELMIQEGSTDELLVSDYEMCGSVTSSTDCLGCLYEEHNLDFLDDLGPQYKVLAEICCGSVIEPEVRSTHTPPKTISSSSQVGVKVESDGGGVQSEVTSVSASSSSSTMEITSTNYGGNINSGGATTTATAGQTLLVQQPNVYLSSTPMYIMEQQHQPTLYLASGPMMGERNMALVENGHSNMTITHQNTLPWLRLQQANSRVQVDQGIEGTVVQGFSGHLETQGAASGTIHVIRNQLMQTQTELVKDQSGEIMVLGNSSVIPNSLSLVQQDVPLIVVPNDITHNKIFQ